jgi:hypothetical protein
LYNSNGYYSFGFRQKGGKMMEKSTTIQEIVERLDKLTPVQQKQILNSVLSFLGEPIRGTSGKELLKFVGLFPPEDLEEIKQAIEEDCGRVDESEW